MRWGTRACACRTSPACPAALHQAAAVLDSPESDTRACAETGPHAAAHAPAVHAWESAGPARRAAPPLQVVPVYSLPEDGNTLTRAYTACPTYDARLLDWWVHTQREGAASGLAPRHAHQPGALAAAGLLSQAVQSGPRHGMPCAAHPSVSRPGCTCSLPGRAHQKGARRCQSSSCACMPARSPSRPASRPTLVPAGTSRRSSRPRRQSRRLCGTASPPRTPASTHR